MKHSQIEAFRAAMLKGKVTAAAEHLNVSQPSVTRLIRELEEEVGFKLFIRRKAGLEPTSAGIQFYKVVDASYIGLSDLETAAVHIREHKLGTMHIAAIPAMGYGFMPEVVARFKKQYPDIELKLNVIPSTEITNPQNFGSYEVGIILEHEFTAKLKTDLFVESSLVLILPSDHRLTKKKVIVPRDLHGEDMISDSPMHETRRDFDMIMKQHDSVANEIIECPLSSITCSFVARGLGVGLVNPFVAYYERHLGHEIRPFKPAITFKKYLVYPRYDSRSPLTDEITRIMEECRDEVLEFYSKE